MTTVETIRRQLEELLPTDTNVTNSLLIELSESHNMTSDSVNGSTSSPSAASILYSSFDDPVLASKYASLAIRHVTSARELTQLGNEPPQLLRIRSTSREIFILPSLDKYILMTMTEVA
ncbi:YALIA101S01e11804g1_1 [Yarrowia lipolytica]|nr:YALIA101S01e11804g1_1 [Yarrowia lipolytica]